MNDNADPILAEVYTVINLSSLFFQYSHFLKITSVFWNHFQKQLGTQSPGLSLGTNEVHLVSGIVVRIK